MLAARVSLHLQSAAIAPGSTFLHFALFMPIRILTSAAAICARASGYRLFTRTDGATEILLEELTVGDKLKVRGVNDTNEGPLSPEITLS